MTVPIPAILIVGVTCIGHACWGRVKVALNSANPVDATTRAAAINGTPVHLEPKPPSNTLMVD